MIGPYGRIMIGPYGRIMIGQYGRIMIGPYGRIMIGPYGRIMIGPYGRIMGSKNIMYFSIQWPLCLHYFYSESKQHYIISLLCKSVRVL